MGGCGWAKKRPKTCWRNIWMVPNLTRPHKPFHTGPWKTFHFQLELHNVRLHSFRFDVVVGQCLWPSRRLGEQEVKKSSVSHSNDVAKIFFRPLKTKEFKDKVDSYGRRSATKGKNVKTAVLPVFCKTKRGGSSCTAVSTAALVWLSCLPKSYRGSAVVLCSNGQTGFTLQ